jgi:hypothetical protein
MKVWINFNSKVEPKLPENLKYIFLRAWIKENFLMVDFQQLRPVSHRSLFKSLRDFMGEKLEQVKKFVLPP